MLAFMLCRPEACPGDEANMKATNANGEVTEILRQLALKLLFRDLVVLALSFVFAPSSGG